MITTIQLEKAITDEQYKKVIELLKSINISVKKDDTKMSKEEFFAKIENSKKQKGTILKSKQEVDKFFSQWI
ncbi:hypothetical protein [Capnocytophaga catalasegens]|uniref:Uncharacterized protein n=1 Tax=Capnocytophaga catalasegens TaxID=1004260 RepID=A0AAV5AWT9_9FLAO|nr:hypothetical protein [Capnocytophaga catalasegens]GIZ15549.1 hypothetical protein RCZ03_15490 [Capnocytophaga catalasegens]GJM49892.1 hypothetical protein RCZ15_08670 [Capnocytophaga catalasegens]GJM54064.1 hypothetical protein RCZ16_23800 [Capnocytophaga catalasegens]